MASATPRPGEGTLTFADSVIPSDAALKAVHPVRVKRLPVLSHIGRYELKHVIGEGGLGRVYDAWDPLGARAVVIKTLQFDLDMAARLVLDRQLLNEARKVMALGHPGIAGVLDTGLSAHGIYIASERLHGRDLRQALALGWSPSVDAATRLARRVADALAFAHANGVRHGGVKPANIFVLPDGRPRLMDFGVGRALRASPLPASTTFAAEQVCCLAPEQLDGDPGDERADVYALAAVLYEMLAGHAAVGATTVAASGAASGPVSGAMTGAAPGAASVGTTSRRWQRPMPLTALRPDVPQALSDLVECALQRDRDARPASAADFAQLLWETVHHGDADMRTAPMPLEPTGRRWNPFAALGTGRTA